METERSRTQKAAAIESRAGREGARPAPHSLLWQCREPKSAKRYNPRKRETRRNDVAMKLIWWAVMGLSVLTAPAKRTARPLRGNGPPCAGGADRRDSRSGPGHWPVRNLSSILQRFLAAIRKLLEQDLKAHGVSVVEDESANSIRVTLSENARGRLWVAEVVEGNTTQVAMVQMSSDEAQTCQDRKRFDLRREAILKCHEPVLAALETANGLVVLSRNRSSSTRRSRWLARARRVSIGQETSIAARSERTLIAAKAAPRLKRGLQGCE